MTERERLVLEPAGGDAEIGRWLSAFEKVLRVGPGQSTRSAVTIRRWLDE